MTTQTNIITDMSAVTKVPNKILLELVDKEVLCIGSAIHDAIITKEPVALLNIGIGTLSIELSTMQCKFVPSKDLKNTIKDCIEKKVDPVEYQLEQAVIDKLLKLCEEGA